MSSPTPPGIAVIARDYGMTDRAEAPDNSRLIYDPQPSNMNSAAAEMAPPLAGCQLRVIRDRAVETLRD